MIATQKPDYVITEYGYPKWLKTRQCYSNSILDDEEIYRIQRKLVLNERKHTKLLPLRTTMNETILERLNTKFFKDTTQQVKQQKNKRNTGIRYRASSRELNALSTLEHDYDGF